ncbi:MAG: sigma-70 family RNA polymerase sigma factor [Gemmatimonadetes bacterium]|nr:sigma-70 family RNA polymerase sigma factor [Gemmatimonadota bacterium]
MAAHRGIVFKLANAYAPTSEEREDLAQEIYLQLWRSFPRYDRERRFSTWMYRIALNVAISVSRRAATRFRHTVPLAPGTEVAETDDDLDPRLEALQAFIQRLGELDRALVLLHLEGHGNREIASVLGITASNVSTKLSRIRGRMRTELTAAEQYEGGT